MTEHREAIEVPNGIDRLRSLIAQDHIDQGADLLAELRDAWRSRPNDFSPGDVASLQELATDIVDARMAAIDRELGATFGYSSFRQDNATLSRPS